MMDEWILVKYPTPRDVLLDDEPLGPTDQPLSVPRGHHVVRLDGLIDYEPRSREVDVTGTTEANPLIIRFTPRRLGAG